MGANISDNHLRTEEVNEVVEATDGVLSARVIRRLYKRFRKLDREGKGTIRHADVLKIPELCMNPFGERIVQCIFQTDLEGRVNFLSFCCGLAAFSERASSAKKAQVLFAVYDMDGDGMVSVEDVAATSRLVVGTHVPEIDVQQSAEQTVSDGDTDRDGMLSVEEVAALLEQHVDLKDALSASSLSRLT
jgi:Ca2+-binding EF-hand superfamily protein